jgi:hypothetical protein
MTTGRLQRAAAFALLLAAWGTPTHAARSASAGRNGAGDLLRDNQRLLDMVYLPNQDRANAAQNARCEIDVGLAWDRDGAGVETQNTPVAFTYSLDPEHGWVYTLASDGYLQADDPAGVPRTKSGVASPSLEISHPLADWLTLSAKVVAPPTRAPGSGTAAQRVKLDATFVPVKDVLTTIWTLALGHDDHVDADTSAFRQLATLELDVQHGDNTGIFSVSHKRQAGTAASTELAIGLNRDFRVPLDTRKNSTVKGSLTFTRGISPGATRSNLEADLKFLF